MARKVKSATKQKTNEGFDYLETDLDFGQLLARHFNRSALSYGQLADAVHRDIGYIHRLINGVQSRPSPNTIIRLALALKLSVIQTDELLMAAGYAPLVYPRPSSETNEPLLQPG